MSRGVSIFYSTSCRGEYEDLPGWLDDYRVMAGLPVFRPIDDTGRSMARTLIAYKGDDLYLVDVIVYREIDGSISVGGRIRRLDREGLQEIYGYPIYPVRQSSLKSVVADVIRLVRLLVNISTARDKEGGSPSGMCGED